MKVAVVNITPELAARYLSTNRANRRIVKSQVARLADDMRKGRWQLTHQGIALNHRGELIDGQHRLSAVLLSGMTVPMVVTSGLHVESAMGLMVDIGNLRTTADVIGQPKEIVQPCSFLMQLHDNTAGGSKARAAEFVDAFGADVRAIIGKHRGVRGVTTVSFVAAGVLQAIRLGHECIAASIDRMARLDFDAMTVAEKNYIRAVHRNAIRTTDKMEVFGKGLVVLDPSLSDMIRIRAADSRMDAARDLLRKEFAARSAVVKQPMAAE